MPNKNKSFGVNLRDMENLFKHRRMPYPKRSAEFIALIAVSCTLFLFMHTKTLNSRLHEMEIKLQPSELSSLGLSGSNAISSGESKHELKGVQGTYQYLKSTGQIKKSETYTLNNTRKAEVDLVIFNRVPKVGSETLMELLKKLGRVNGFKTSRNIAKRKEQVFMGPMEQMELSAELLALEEPIVYSQHLAFINFTKMDLPRPIYINMVRDPIERVISWHYYIRTPRYYEQLRKIHGEDIKTPDENFMNMDFDTCVRTGNKACQFVQASMKDDVADHRRQTLFFCGHSRAACLPFNSKTALERAKRTVEEEYSVVGTWEDTNTTLSVFEKYIPKFFKHAKFAYYLAQDQLSKVNKNFDKKEVSEEVREMLRQNFTREIEFYQFCRQRLYKQYEALRLDKTVEYDDSGEL